MDSLLNFHQSTETIGTSGQPSADQFREIASIGYQAVVNLAMPDSDDALENEGSLVTSEGMAYFHIPVPFDDPQPAHLKTFFGVMDALEGQKVLVHCQVNARVSAFMHQYLTLTKGKTSEEASSPLLGKWRPRMDDVWKRVLSWDLKDIDPA